MLARLALPLTISFAAAATVAIEGVSVASWAGDRSAPCSGPSPAEACSLNGVIAMVAGCFFAVETLAAVLVALILARGGKRFGAGVAIAALLCALALEHLWLLT
jgi:hypothetical protein